VKKIYLACPYSDPDPAICEQRVLEADRIAAQLMVQGNIVFSPLSHSHRIAHHIENHQDCDFWLSQDLAFIDWADEIVVLKLDGWDKSKGIKIELEHAQAKGVPITWMEP
jgi:nucleoside 2-deoxyribosyltransferase